VEGVPAQSRRFLPPYNHRYIHFIGKPLPLYTTIKACFPSSSALLALLSASFILLHGRPFHLGVPFACSVRGGKSFHFSDHLVDPPRLSCSFAHVDPTFLAGGLALTMASMALAFLAGGPFVAFALKAGIRTTFLTS
jgi:hypothetical protein